MGVVKAPAFTSMNRLLLTTLHPDEVDAVIQQGEEAEVDEMRSYMGKEIKALVTLVRNGSPQWAHIGVRLGTPQR
jgi:hypothetical protein